MGESTEPTEQTARAAAPGAAATKKDINDKMRALVDRRLAQSAARSEGVLRRTGAADLPYQAVAEFIPVVANTFASQPEEPQAAVFTIAYLATGPDHPHAGAHASARPGAGHPRPICFAFNGGPGSSSIWLHLGALGPKRVVMPDDGSMPPPPYAVRDNPLSWLAHFDLVFIDPPHTGFSIAAGEEARDRMLGVDGDVDALTAVIHAWLARNKRFGSAVLVAGESYGTTRGAAIAEKLLDRGVALSGLVLVSCAMDLQTLEFVPGNDLPYALFLPGYACAAQYHGRLAGPAGASPAAAREAAEAFVVEEYLAALHRGGTLTTPGRQRIAARVAELSGLPVALVEQKNLRISDVTFFTQLLREQGKIVGRLEARVTGPFGASRHDAWEFDPGIEALVSPYAMAGQAYFAETLGLATDMRYEILSDDVHKKWNWSRGERKGNGFACTSPDLARALRRNPHLRVFVASGYYDLGTPYSATNYSLAQLDVPADVAQRVTHRYYDAGHMMYTRSADLQRLFQEVGAWVQG
ncbi:MAG TPA: peptidase S10 [Burkholderiaceae bacterium]|nr:peptidase S10 [Burkholderiaceae bacterium]